MSKPLKKSNKVKKKRPTLSKEAPTTANSKSLRGALTVKYGLPTLNGMREEVDHMVAILLGREEPPINIGVHTLQEVADGYFARASELTMLIQRLEADGVINKGDPLYKFRTGELRTFLELSKRAAELGSRRLTREQLQWDQSRTGRDSRGGVD